MSAAAAPGGTVHELASLHRGLDPSAHPTASIRDHRKALAEALERARSRLEAAAALGMPVGVAGQWLLDNVHVVREALAQVLEDLPPSFFRRLPAGSVEEGETWPRVRELARGVVAESADGFDPDVLTRLVVAYQEVLPLAIGELWALPALLRLRALEELAEVAGALSEDASGDQEAARRAGRAVLGLRTLAGLDWRRWFEAVSLTERALREDPAGVYVRMDPATRDLYRNAVEALAGGDASCEVEVARRAVALAREATTTALERHVGHFLIGEGLPRLIESLPERLRRGPLRRARLRSLAPGIYLGGLAVVVAGILAAVGGGAAAAGGGPVGVAVAVALALIPALTLAVSATHAVVPRLVPPQVLPKLDLHRGIGRENRTLVVFPVLLSSVEEVDALLRGLEVNFLANSDPEMAFALASDGVDAPAREMPEDAALLERAQVGIRRLNQDHATNAFHLLHRERLWNPAEGCWMGWERKRGKLEELGRWLEGAEDTGFLVHEGDRARLEGVRYVVTLDADTFLPRGAASRLVGTFAHPLQRPVQDAEGRVLSGYTVLQPRVEVTPASAERSRFARLFAAAVGMDLYGRAVSDVYQDLFGEGIYAGKGIYDLRAFRLALEGRVPENGVLSHDLLEGVLGRAGLVSDVTVLEEHPTHVLAYLERFHRWTRGDWQLLPWLGRSPPGSRGTRLSALDRWKIVDNLRRSLVAPAHLLLLVAGWTVLPGSPWAWTGLAALSLAAGLPLEGLGLAWRVVRERPRGRALRDGAGTLGRTAQRALVELALLPALAAAALDAVGRTLYRLGISRRDLLEWTPAAAAGRRVDRRSGAVEVWSRMVAAPALAVGVGVLVAVRGGAAIPAALPWLLLWGLSPQLAHGLSRPRPRPEPRVDPGRDRRLRLLARRTWHFFERFVGPGDHWLPPDNYQEAPGDRVAHRTSPTNTGFYLLSALVAHDLGYLDAPELVARVRSTLETLRRLERHRGHVVNWLETETLEPLEPRFVSTVDSGNLAACLVTLAQGLREIAEAPVPHDAVRPGLADAVGLLREAVAAAGASRQREECAALEALLEPVERRLRAPAEGGVSVALEPLEGELFPRLDELLAPLAVAGEGGAPPPGSLGEIRTWVERLHHGMLAGRRCEEALVPWRLRLEEAPALLRDPQGPLASAWEELREALPGVLSRGAVPAACRRGRELVEALGRRAQGATSDPDEGVAARRYCEELAAALEGAGAAAVAQMEELDAAAREAEAMVEAMDFSFLFDRDRRLFHLGLDISRGRLTPDHYDLLASESRLASFLAIAKGDAPMEHWLHLGRPVGWVGGSRAYLSWSGTSFEYLMANLLLRCPEGSSLEASCRAAIRGQMKWARDQGIPWGVSESAFHHLGAQGWYQYRAFGVPGTGLRRGLGERRVVAPYASLLALSLVPDAVVENLDRLEALGMVGRYGLYEAADFGPRGGGKVPQRVRCYMSHHQGMALAALGNLLTGGALVRRFHRSAEVATVEALVYEELGRAPVTHPRPSEEAAPREEPVALHTWPIPEEAPWPSALALSNGRYHLTVTSRGGGRSTWEDLALNPWSPDSTLEERGWWIYLRDLETGEVTTVGRAREGAREGFHEILFAPHRAEFGRAWGSLRSRLTVAVASGDAMELRLLHLSNEGDRPRALEVTSFVEVALAPAEEQARHPAFARLFVEGELAAPGVPMLRRRPRARGDPRAYLVQAMVPEPASEVETDRARFLGRGRGARAPAAMEPGAPPLSGTVGATLDPALALRRTVLLQPGEERELAILQAAGRTREEVLGALERHRTLGAVHLAMHEAGERARTQLRAAGVAPEAARLAHELLSAVLFPHPARRADAWTLASNRLGPRALWGHGLSGDLPLLVVALGERPDRGMVARVLGAHALWRGLGVRVDLVLLDQGGGGYEWPLRDWVDEELQRTHGLGWMHRPGGVYLLRGGELRGGSRGALLAAARVVLDGDEGDHAAQLAALRRSRTELPAFVPILPPPSEEPPGPAPERPADLRLDCGYGGVSADGREYVVCPEPGHPTPAPWANVIANESFGFMVTERGGGHTWAGSSAENRLSPWRNDPVTDAPGEALYLRDEETGAVWSPTPAPAPAPGAYRCHHRAGGTRFVHRSHDLDQELDLAVPPEAPVKMARLRLENRSARPRRITATYVVEWVLGERRERTAPHLVTDFDPGLGVLLVRNPFHLERPEATAFLAADRPPHGFTVDRTELFGPGGDRARPAALGRIGLAETARPGSDPCGALQVHVDLPPGGSAEVCFFLGQGADRREALALVERFRAPEAAARAAEEAGRGWDVLLERIQVETPEPALDLMVNRFAPYQALACRVRARTGLYQSSGAYGFRDQLQDAVALLPLAPERTREHLLVAAAHQFEAGDVLHWWHPEAERGVRTRCSDDLLWLPWAVVEYLDATGDAAVLDEEVPFLAGDPLEPGELERYDAFLASADPASLYEHCLRAIERGATRSPRGLPGIGTCDWNDGLSNLGAEGRGESMWLAWFLVAVLEGFAPVCTSRGDAARAEELRGQARGYAAAVEAHGWDGEWYRRATDDAGVPLGSAGDEECRIDLIAQAWAVLSGAAPPARAHAAMGAAWRELRRSSPDLLCLLAPPFDKGARDPGYIQGYPPGVRENGGQYNHAAAWAARAFAELGDGDRALQVLRMMNPLERARDRGRATRYRLEPYALAGDVCAVSPHEGRGGWSWYTGAAGWFYKVALESLLGLRVRAAGLEVRPCLPAAWPGYRARLRVGGATYAVEITRGEGAGRLVLDGEVLAGPSVPLRDDGREHRLEVELKARVAGAPGPAPSAGSA